MGNSSSNPIATNRQVPDHAILDISGKQTYLGNQFSAAANFTISNSEVPLLLLQNIQSGSSQILKALFQNSLKVSENTAAKTVQINTYLNPTTAAGAQTIAFAADSSGSLNSTWFSLYDEQGHSYYVWFNINSAGVDPAPVGYTAGVQVAGATNDSAATLGTTAKPLIAALNSSLSFSVAGTSTLTITNLVKGFFTPAADGTAPTGFVFTVTKGWGTQLTPVNLRPAYGNTSIGLVSSSPVASANGTLVESMSAAALSVNSSNTLRILDNGQTMLITGVASTSSTAISMLLGWYEL